MSISEFHPSNHQNLISHAVLRYTGKSSEEHNIAVLAVTSSRFSRGSLVPNIVDKITFDSVHRRLVSLFSDPNFTTTIQFCSRFAVWCSSSDDVDFQKFILHFFSQMCSSTQYFTRSIRCLELSVVALSDQFLDQVISTFVNLEDLALQFCSEKNMTVDVGVAQHLCKVGCRQLLKFSVSGSNSVVASPRAVSVWAASWKFLTHLSFDLCDVFDDECLQHISSLKHVESLALITCRQISDEGVLRHVANSPFLPSTLLHLTVINCTNVADRALDGIVTKCQRLETLVIRVLPQLSDAGLMRLFAPGNKQLKSLGLEFVKNLAGNWFVGASSQTLCFPQLTSLCLDGCSNIKNENLICLLNPVVLPCVTTLRVDYCTQITDDVLVQGVAKLTSLTVITLDNLSRVTDVGVRALAATLKNLTAASFCEGRSITDAAVIDICTSCAKIESLNLNYCTKLTEKIVPHLLTLKFLTYLNLASTPLEDRGSGLERKLKNAFPSATIVC